MSVMMAGLNREAWLDLRRAAVQDYDPDGDDVVVHCSYLTKEEAVSE